MTKPRKYKAKPPISQLDDVAATHRRAQSCKAQRAYRQRKEDTIATLTTQISDLELTIERLSCCFLGLNDRVFEYLGTIEGRNDPGSAALAGGIRDAMKEFKEIVEGEDASANITEAQRGDKAVPLRPNDKDHSLPAQQFYPSPSASSGCDIPLQQTQPQPRPQQKIFTDKDLAVIPFSGPTFLGLTPTTAPPHHPASTLARSLTPATAISNHYALAGRIYHSTVTKGFSVVYDSGPPSPLFRRIFALFFCGESDEQVKYNVTQMFERRVVWSCFDTLTGSAKGWWSSLQVAGFVLAQGGWFDEAQDKLIMRRRSGGEVSADVEPLLDELCADARCGLEDPEYKEESVIQTLRQITG
ncbi:hypothetical protein M436DRAFT_47473 [Aureobasidium namibiae CBS 147.97]|uniref:BZIP domain-containing protein n=1 Tax=Aureobasidium namibiae CBS 147.97 TaxID=1043004 RepID=A0A074XDV6_9PEZI|nr:uncharacterized protein M436DRAFT_47473 [Aureobasidium namibiae CBS 147.97]KEQ72806.1 hypothetical protein M436DRAFT_47473 [Aureobasidium namibiae CBS 147.97]